MKRLATMLLFGLSQWMAMAQEPEELPVQQDQMLENLAEKEDRETEDDFSWQEIEAYRHHHLDLNRAGREQLQALGILSALQIESLIRYRSRLGSLISVYELQAIPGWPAALVRGLLPFVTVNEEENRLMELKKSWKSGYSGLLIRIAQTLERSKGYEKKRDSLSHYLGSPQRIFMRYDYRLMNNLQFGFLGDKDAGEPFFRGKQKAGFDFYSFHLFAHNQGRLQALALGDFSLCMGQGLIHWQGRGATKSSDVMAIKRQNPVLRPYHSAGEYNFHRGAALTLSYGKWETSAFFSYRKISSNLVSDTSGREDLASSFQTSGYHRTQAENDDRNNLGRLSAGSCLRYIRSNSQFGFNGIYHQFDRWVEKQDQPYNLFAWKGRSIGNLSMDYSITWHNTHSFGEMALDQHLNRALVHGTMLSLGSLAEAAFLFRHISNAFHSLDGNAFTENAAPTNETGWYMGIQLRPQAGWQLSLFYDGFQFPWLRYRADGPGYGRDFLCQLNYQPSKDFSLYMRFVNRAKTMNAAGSDSALHHQQLNPRKDWVTGFSYRLNANWQFRSRLQAVWAGGPNEQAEKGFLGLFEMQYKAARRPYTLNVRLQYFETGGYNARIYVYESDVLFGYSMPVFYEKGFRYYINFHGKFPKGIGKQIKLDYWIRWSGDLYPGKSSLGSGLEEINANHKEEIKCQILLKWGKN